MALRLRRGTNAQRLGITFAEGELVYTTDTKKLYIGDGSVAGGNLVSGMNNVVEDATPQLGGNLDLNGNNITGTGNININGTLSISTGFLKTDIQGSVFADDSGILVDGIAGKHILTNNVIGDLGNVASTAPTTGQVLKWSGTTWTPSDDSVTPNLALDGLSNVSAASPTQNQALVWNGSAWVPGDVIQQGEFLDGDFRGSLFGDDSTLIVDGVNNIITTQNIKANGTFTINGPTNATFQVQAEADQNHATFKCVRKTTANLSSDTGINGRLIFAYDDVNGELSTGLFYSSKDYIRISSSVAGSFTDAETVTIANSGGAIKLGVGLTAPTEALDVNGAGKYTSFVQFGSFTNAQRNALTAANGMIIYNSETNKFQGYEGGAWVNLI